MRSAITATGIGAAKSAIRSAEPLSLESVDLLMRQGRDPRPKGLDPARDEGAVDETPQPCVLGRLELQDRMAFDRIERREMGFGRRPAERLAAHHMQDLPAEALVAQERRDVSMRCKAPEAVILPEERGRSGADRGISRIGIAEESGVARVQADAAPRGVDDQSHERKP